MTAQHTPDYLWRVLEAQADDMFAQAGRPDAG